MVCVFIEKIGLFFVFLRKKNGLERHSPIFGSGASSFVVVFVVVVIVGGIALLQLKASNNVNSLDYQIMNLASIC